MKETSELVADFGLEGICIQERILVNLSNPLSPDSDEHESGRSRHVGNAPNAQPGCTSHPVNSATL